MDRKTRQDLLGFGVLSMSLSEYPLASMKLVVDDFIANAPNGSVRAAMQEGITAYGYHSTPEISLMLLKSILDGETATPEQGNAFKMQATNVNWFIMAITMFLVFLRLLSKRLLKGRLGWDDFTLCLACGATVSYIIVLRLDSMNHMSCDHIWNVSWSEYRYLLKGLYDAEVVYCFTNITSKIAILHYFYTLVPRETTFHYFHRSIFAAQIFSVVVMVSSLGTTAFQCKPIDFWNLTNPMQMNSECVPRSALWTVTSATAALTNLVCITLPIKIVWSLRLTTKQKFMATGMFSLGALAAAACTYRMIIMWRFLNDPDWTYWQCYADAPSVLESALAIHTACIPSIKALVCTYMPSIFKSVESGVRKRFGMSSLQTTGILELTVTRDITVVDNYLRRPTPISATEPKTAAIYESVKEKLRLNKEPTVAVDTVSSQMSSDLEKGQDPEGRTPV